MSGLGSRYAKYILLIQKTYTAIVGLAADNSVCKRTVVYMGYMEEHTNETAPSFSSSATPVVGYKADNSDITFYFAYL